MHQSVSEVGSTEGTFRLWVEPIQLHTGCWALSWRGGAQNVPGRSLDGNTEYLSAGDDVPLAVCRLQETLSHSHVALFFHWKGWMAELGQGRVGLEACSLQRATTLDWALSVKVESGVQEIGPGGVFLLLFCFVFIQLVKDTKRKHLAQQKMGQFEVLIPLLFLKASITDTGLSV